MLRREFTKLAMVAAVVATPAKKANAAGWADGLFSTLAHDFGSVPRGAKVRHEFVLTNRLPEPITILDVHASCGCTTGRITAKVVAPGQSANVEAQMDTRNFVGKKATVLYVTLVTASGRQAEVRLGVSSTILSDLVLNPGTLDFGLVERGRAPILLLQIDRVASPGWEVQRIVSGCRAIDATLTERVRNAQTVSYVLKVNIRPDAMSGVVRDEIRLFTNDPETPFFPIPITATIRGDLSVSPSILALGHVTSAGGAQGRYLIRASKPFTIRAFEGEGDGFEAKIDDETPKSVHIVTLTYKPIAGAPLGDLRRVFRVHTDLAGEPPLDVSAILHVSP